MKCPQCGKEMEKGFISSRDSVLLEWVKGEESPRTEGFGSIETLIYKPYFWWGYLEAYRCPDCELLLLSYHKDSKTALDMIHSRNEGEQGITDKD